MKPGGGGAANSHGNLSMAWVRIMDAREEEEEKKKEGWLYLNHSNNKVLVLKT